MKILYIAGDGRSGSTLLESVLGNVEQTTGIGEAYRFWDRFYEARSVCACGSHIGRCPLWHGVHERLNMNSGYDPAHTWRLSQEVRRFSTFNKLAQFVRDPAHREFCKEVETFYRSASELSNGNVLIDSSKSIGWLKLICEMDFADVRIIHLERRLPEVANSWQKSISLPEYPNDREQMPVKPLPTSIKTWAKTKYLARHISTMSNYSYLPYDYLCSNPTGALHDLESLIDERIPTKDLRMMPSHAIAGNPMRHGAANTIDIRPAEEPDLSELTRLERVVVRCSEKVLNKVL